jgi:hypothetical protein
MSSHSRKPPPQYAAFGPAARLLACWLDAHLLSAAYECACALCACIVLTHTATATDALGESSRGIVPELLLAHCCVGTAQYDAPPRSAIAGVCMCKCVTLLA